MNIRRQILGMFAYPMSDGSSFFNYQYNSAAGIALLPPNMAKLKMVADLLGEEIFDNRSRGQPLSEPFQLQPEFQPRDYQEDPSQHLIDYIKEHYYGTLEAGCGTGKTVVMTYAAGHLNCKILILVDQSNLITGWTDAAQFIWGRKLQKITAKTTEFGDMCFSTFQLLAQNDQLLKRIRKEFGCCLIDECHTAKAATFKRVMFGLNNQYRIGCSATFFGKNLPQGVLHDIIAPTCVTMVDPHALTPDVHFVDTGVPFLSNDPSVFGNKTLPALAMDERRNAVIYKLIKERAAAGRRILVIGIKNDQAKLLCALIERLGISATVYTGSTSVKRDLQVKNDFNSGKLQVVFTSKKLDKGTDLASADTLINAKPSNNEAVVRQQSGRIVRIWEGKPLPELYDLRDAGSLSETFARNRARWYRDLGYRIITV